MLEQFKNLSVSDLTKLLLEASDKEVEEYNTLLEAYEELQNFHFALKLKNSTVEQELEAAKEKIKQLTTSIEEYKGYSDTIVKNGNKHLEYAEQARREKNQALDKLAQAEILLTNYKNIGTPKKIKEQIKSYKEKAASNLKTINARKVETKGYKQEVIKLVDKIHLLEAELSTANITTIYSKGKDKLLVFPKKLTMAINGVEEKQLTLLYMDNSGCGKLIGLDENSEPSLCSMPKSGLKPSKSTMEVAGNMLRKLKSQDWKMQYEDLTRLSNI